MAVCIRQNQPYPGVYMARAIALACERSWVLLINNYRPLQFAQSLGVQSVTVPGFCVLLYADLRGGAAMAGIPYNHFLFGLAERERREQAMFAAIEEVTQALETLGRPGPWSADIKASDDFLDPVFERYFRKLGLSNLMRKTDYHYPIAHAAGAG